jgi:hypothetical protein
MLPDCLLADTSGRIMQNPIVRRNASIYFFIVYLNFEKELRSQRVSNEEATGQNTCISVSCLRYWLTCSCGESDQVCAAFNRSRTCGTNCQLPTVICQPPTANRHLSTANCQLPTVNCQLPTANRQPILDLGAIYPLQYLCTWQE